MLMKKANEGSAPIVSCKELNTDSAVPTELQCLFCFGLFVVIMILTLSKHILYYFLSSHSLLCHNLSSSVSKHEIEKT